MQNGQSRLKARLLLPAQLSHGGSAAFGQALASAATFLFGETKMKTVPRVVVRTKLKNACRAHGECSINTL